MTTVTEQLWSIATTTVQVRLMIQLNSVLFAKTLVRKDVASSAPPPSSSKDSKNADAETSEEDEDNFSSKAQIMTLMTTDVNRVSDFGWHILALVGSRYPPLYPTNMTKRQCQMLPWGFSLGHYFCMIYLV